MRNDHWDDSPRMPTADRAPIDFGWFRSSRVIAGGICSSPGVARSGRPVSHVQPDSDVARQYMHEAMVGRNDWFMPAGCTAAGLHVCDRRRRGAVDFASDKIDSSRSENIGLVVSAGALDTSGKSEICRAVAEPGDLSRQWADHGGRAPQRSLERPATSTYRRA